MREVSSACLAWPCTTEAMWRVLRLARHAIILAQKSALRAGDQYCAVASSF